MAAIDQYFSANQAALNLRNTRLELISQNIANAVTPNYRARDIDFSVAMKSANTSINIQSTNRGHMQLSAESMITQADAIVYRQPLNPSLDNNTVEMGVEQAKFGRAAADYQASLQFLESRISGLRKALRGD